MLFIDEYPPHPRHGTWVRPSHGQGILFSMKQRHSRSVSILEVSSHRLRALEHLRFSQATSLPVWLANRGCCSPGREASSPQAGKAGQGNRRELRRAGNQPAGLRDASGPSVLWTPTTKVVNKATWSNDPEKSGIFFIKIWEAFGPRYKGQDLSAERKKKVSA